MSPLEQPARPGELLGLSSVAAGPLTSHCRLKSDFSHRPAFVSPLRGSSTGAHRLDAISPAVITTAGLYRKADAIRSFKRRSRRAVDTTCECRRSWRRQGLDW
jgi:hypothetical protein